MASGVWVVEDGEKVAGGRLDFEERKVSGDEADRTPLLREECSDDQVVGGAFQP